MATDGHLITVGIPSFNNEATIGETILSLRHQTFEDWRCVLADDSTLPLTVDRAYEAIDGDERFTVVRNVERLGAAGNWNKVLSMAESRYFKLLCADDVLYSDALERHVNAFSRNRDAVLVTAKRDVIDSEGRILFKNRGYDSETSFECSSGPLEICSESPPSRSLTRLLFAEVVVLTAAGVTPSTSLVTSRLLNSVP
jgi:glycosyltransferase involved in cell wall biosynthesis